MKRILIVDDNVMIAAIYRNKFARRGFAAEVACDGKDGIYKIEHWKPDAVLLDLMMPNIDGMSMLRSIRSNTAICDLPVVVYSSSFSKGTEDEARKLGVTRLLSKSDTRPDQLLEMITELLGSAPQEESVAVELEDRAACMQTALTIAAEMRPLLKDFFSQNQSSVLSTLQHKAYTFTANAWTAGMRRASLVGEALESLLRTLSDRTDYLNLSTYKTVLQAVECLEGLIEISGVDEAPLKAPQVLIVDDQELSVQAATRAINKAKMRAYPTIDPLEGLRLLEAHAFDLVILDVDMPEMSGNQLCQRLRRFPWHENTPVIFFSKLSEIGDRMRAASVGGSDFIAKPFLTIELAVKALVWVWKPKEGNAKSVSG